MNLTARLLAASALTAAAGAATAQELTFVSWGGAYQKSQLNAYVEPYIANNPGISVVWDESSAEAVAKLRAMNEAGNITWDVVDVVAADAIRLCDEGLAMEIDPDEHLLRRAVDREHDRQHAPRDRRDGEEHRQHRNQCQQRRRAAAWP